MSLDSAVHSPAVLADRPQLLGDYRKWLVGGVLLHTRHPARQPVLLPHDPAVEGIDGDELGGGDVREVASGAALEEVGELGLELGAGDGVEEADGEGGAATAQPEEGVLEGGDPGGAEERRGVELGELGPGGAVVLEMLERLLDEVAEVVGVGAVGVKHLEELLEVLVLLVDPILKATMEETMAGTRHGKGKKGKNSEKRRDR